MSYGVCNGICKNFKVARTINGNYGGGFVKCMTCNGARFHKDITIKKGKYLKQYCPCCGSQVRSKPRHWTKTLAKGIDTRIRVQ